MMIKLEQANSKMGIVVICIEGQLNASNYKDLINLASQAKEEGTQYLYIDMSEMTSLSSSGVFALNSIALLMRGIEPPSPEHGWNAYHALAGEQGNGRQEKVKFLNPPQTVDRMLDITGMKAFFETLTTQDADSQMILSSKKLLTDPAACCSGFTKEV
jgi:anti-anti-sigma regulatory factor